MKRTLFLILALVLALTMVTSGGVAAGGPEDWPMFHHDLSLSGASRSKAPNTNEVAWTYPAGAATEASPVITDSMVYIGDIAGKFYALHADSGALIFNSPIFCQYATSNPTNNCNNKTYHKIINI